MGGLALPIEKGQELTMISSPRNILLAVIASTVMIWAVAFVCHHKQKPALADTQLKEAYDLEAKFRARIDQDITRLERESMAESMVKLSHVNMFYSSGPPMQNMIALDHFPPLGEGAGIKALDAIMSNRRFRKVFDEISKMDKAAASEVVNRELLAAIAEYLPLYDGHMRRFAPHFKPYTTNSQHVVVGPSFEVGNVPEGQVTIVGTKLKVLALVWICGMLELNGTKDQVEHVARLSVRQRTDLYEDPILSPIHKYELLEMASLYNRPIISSGVFGMQTNRNLEAHILKAAGAEWQERKLAVFTAALTEYDFYARRGRKPDYSRGSLTVKFVSPLNDDSFDLVLRELHVF